MLNLLFPLAAQPHSSVLGNILALSAKEIASKKQLSLESHRKGQTSHALCTVHIGVRGEETQNITRVGRSVPGNSEGCLTFSRQARQSPCTSRESFPTSGKFGEGFRAALSSLNQEIRGQSAKQFTLEKLGWGEKKQSTFSTLRLNLAMGVLHKGFFCRCPWSGFVRKRRKSSWNINTSLSEKLNRESSAQTRAAFPLAVAPMWIWYRSSGW